MKRVPTVCEWITTDFLKNHFSRLVNNGYWQRCIYKVSFCPQQYLCLMTDKKWRNLLFFHLYTTIGKTNRWSISIPPVKKHIFTSSTRNTGRSTGKRVKMDGFVTRGGIYPVQNGSWDAGISQAKVSMWCTDCMLTKGAYPTEIHTMNNFIFWIWK